MKARTEVTKFERKSLGFLFAGYFSALASDRNVAMAYLHQSNTWQITIFSGALFSCFVQDSFPSVVTLLIASVALVSTANFLTRSAKAYLNIVRWSTIERAILHLMTCDDVNETEILTEKAWEAVEIYHINWSSPLNRRDVLVKVMFEFGYFFQIAALLFVMSASLLNGCDIVGISIFVGMIFLSMAEIFFGFWRSPYFAKIQSDETTKSLK